MDKIEILNFIENNNFNDENLSTLLNKMNINKKNLIKKTFRLLKEYYSIDELDSFDVNNILKITNFISFLCNEELFDREEIEINRLRIKKARERLLYLYNLLDDNNLLIAANTLDEIILDKIFNTPELIKLLKILIDKNEDVNIIKKIINTNKKCLFENNCELFDYVFNKAITSIENSTRDIYYYITLLKILYTSSINKTKYIKLLNTIDVTNPFGNEIYLIVNGVKRNLSAQEILEKYEIVENLVPSKIILPKNATTSEKIITIDGNKTFLRDDGISIRKDGNNYIIGIHIADTGKFITPGSVVDIQALDNFECKYLSGGKRTRIFSPSIENALSLDENKVKPVISIYVVMNDSGEILDYSIQENNIFVNKNLTYLQSEEMLNSRKCSELEKHLKELYMLSCALEDKNHSKQKYWAKKEQYKTNKKLSETKSDIIVREFMGLYNHLMAKNALDLSIPFIYRVQEKEYISSLIDEENIKVDDFTLSIIRNIYLNSYYSVEPKPHLGLNLEIYAHTCDALRRYPDLYNQYLTHMFYFKDLNFDFDLEYLKKLVEYFNQRRDELTLMKAEYDREMRLNKKHY